MDKPQEVCDEKENYDKKNGMDEKIKIVWLL